ncbi:hypothetical protein, partial [Pseudooceanicola nanhaiensis]|uniref:hypothetical protein n=1 Tax=Pseudooceanicola nanhaiensis TaxID=375761 RepID=UPI0040592366
QRDDRRFGRCGNGWRRQRQLIAIPSPAEWKGGRVASALRAVRDFATFRARFCKPRIAFAKRP